MAVYVISDTHFGHGNILRHRPEFESIEAHDRVITDRILSLCGKFDSLYVLGDVVVYQPGMRYLEEIASRIGFLHIILGNHDNERKGAPALADYLPLCKSIGAIKHYKNAWLTHAPIHPDELRGNINIHGHVHGRSINDTRYINVSCEALEYTPVDMARLLG
ncbi:metallophosphoesterase family protein [Larsenimonas salina]|uniref:metallophosphoesterase family protein n=1 Tax=Larsenimonas salina TaxID=1295565 RepID=UPI002073A7D6|nr:metallophosphoesterase [Larsenimonas salina]MCM5703631.1 metallophosphoesterase family protein [Larsenimonas salina]